MTASQPLTNAEALKRLLRKQPGTVYDATDNATRRDAREQHAVAHVLATLATIEDDVRAMFHPRRSRR